MRSAALCKAALFLGLAVVAAAQNSSAADIRYIVQDYAFGCRNGDEYMRLAGLAGEDREAFGKLLAADFLSGKCAPLPLGAEAFVVGESDIFALVRLRGGPVILWTSPKSVAAER